jgi:hypothetical protein
MHRQHERWRLGQQHAEVAAVGGIAGQWHDSRCLRREAASLQVAADSFARIRALCLSFFRHRTTYRLIYLSTHRPIDLSTHRLIGLSTYGTLGPWDLRTLGPSDLRTLGPSDLRTLGLIEGPNEQVMFDSFVGGRRSGAGGDDGAACERLPLGNPRAVGDDAFGETGTIADRDIIP